MEELKIIIQALGCGNWGRFKEDKLRYKKIRS